MTNICRQSIISIEKLHKLKGNIPMKAKYTRLVSLLLVGILLILSFVGCSSTKKIVICRECRTENPYIANFCLGCGAELWLDSGSGNSEVTTPNIDASQNTTPSIGGFEETTPSIDESQGTTPNIGGSEETTPSEDEEFLPDETWLLLESHVKSSGYTLKYYYDDNGYLLASESWDTSGTLRFQTIYTNDSYGNCVLMHIPLYKQLGFDADITIRNTYDGNGRLIKAYNEDWESYDQYFYDGDELVKIVHTEQNGEQSYEEYENGKLVRTFEDGETTEYYYDSKGRCTGTSDETLTVDEYGNITEDSEQTNRYITLDDYLAQNLHKNSYNKNNSGSGGNSSGGNSSGGSSSPSVCSACRGTGQGDECIGCDGKGQAISYYVNGSPVYRTCNGCKGKGYIICAYCGGDGYR